ncbi:MAG: glycosyltransferase family 4 protein, partial [Verrucomicrobiota bacterium]
MKVVMVEPGGFRATFQYTHNLCNALGRKGHEVILVTATEYETESFPREYDAIKVFDRFKPQIARLRELRRRMREFDPDVVHIQGHSHPTSYQLVRSWIGGVCNPRFVYTAQDVIPKKPLPHHFPALKRLYRVMEHIFVNAEHNKQTVVDRFGADPQKISVHPIPDLLDFLKVDDPERSDLVPADKKVILFFGNIEPRKGVAPLIESFPEVLEKIPDAYLLIAGKPMGDDASVYEKQIQ